MGSGAPMMTQTERRKLLHTTRMQDQRYQACAHAMSNVHGDLHRMQQHVNGSSSSGPPPIRNSRVTTRAMICQAISRIWHRTMTT